MIFILLVFIAAFGIEAIGTYVSVIGLSTLFGANPIIIALAVALDIGKLLVVSLLYTYWKRLNFLMKTYALIAAVVTMTITSAGAAGYLSGEFQKAIIGTQEGTLKVAVLKEEQAKLEARKSQIDTQIAELPKNYSSARIRLMKEFSEEQKRVTDRLSKISEELPALQIQQISVEAKAGPILYISKAFDVPVEVAVKWVILLIIFVFDPLAVYLIIAGNFLLHQRRTHKEQHLADADLFKDDDDPSGGGPPGFTPPKPMPPAPAPAPAARAAMMEEAIEERAEETPASSPINLSYQMEQPLLPKQPEAVVEEPLFRDEPSTEIISAPVPFSSPSPERDHITLSSLKGVKPDAQTIVSVEDNGALTPPARPDIYYRQR